VPVVLRSVVALAIALSGIVGVALFPTPVGAGERDGYAITIDADGDSVTAELTRSSGEAVTGQRLDLALVGVGAIATAEPAGPHGGTCITDAAGRCFITVRNVLAGETTVVAHAERQDVSGHLLLGG
jgi:hypothetical protein